MQVTPYLSFEGRCEEALDFYKTAVGADVQCLMRFKEMPDKSHLSPDMEDKVMHSTVRIGESTVMASDGHCSGQLNLSGVSLTLTVADDAEAERVFAALTEGGEVRMPMTTTFFSSRFGSGTDRFGVTWMVMTRAQ
jgi:PhnB protein